MYEITVEHKYCKCVRHLSGYSIAEIFKSNNLDYSFWIIIDIDKKEV